MSDLSENIVILRKQNEMSQSDLANILFVTPQAISRWERGETEPDIETIKKLAEVFKVSVEEIIYGPTSKLSKKMKTIIHRAYFVGSVLMVVLSIVFAILAILGLDYLVILLIFASLAILYFAFLMVCEIIQTKLKRIPAKQEENKKSSK